MSDKRAKPVDSSDRDIRQAPRRRGRRERRRGEVRVRVEVVVAGMAVGGGRTVENCTL